MSKLEQIKSKYAEDSKVLRLIDEIQSAMEPLATAVLNAVNMPKVVKFRMAPDKLLDFSDKLSEVEHKAHMAILRPVRALDEYLGLEWETGCIVDAPPAELKTDFRGAVKNWALRLCGVSETFINQYA